MEHQKTGSDGAFWDEPISVSRRPMRMATPTPRYRQNYPIQDEHDHHPQSTNNQHAPVMASQHLDSYAQVQSVYAQPGTTGQIGQFPRRKLTLGENSHPDAQVIVRGVHGDIIAVLHGSQMPHQVKTVPIKTRQDIQSIEVFVEGKSGTCDVLQSAGWLDTTNHLQVDVAVKNGQVLCGLSNRASANQFPDREATTPGTVCRYIMGENNKEGSVQCRADFGSNAELVGRRS